MNILQACNDPKLFKPWFARGDWSAWHAFLAALFALPMTEDQLAIYRRHTGREDAPTEPCEEAWLVIGRRGGKSFLMALTGVFLACFRDYRQYLQPGERATVAIIDPDRKQARVVLRYVRGLITHIPMLAAMVERETADGFDLTNGATLEITSASMRTSRGYTFAAVLVDEIAFLRTDDSAANPDSEILNAVRPGLATIPGAPLICASSPYARTGEVWQAFRKFYGKPNAPLVWKATTREMNPSVRQQIVDDALEADYARANSEYNAEFRTDVETFVAREVVDQCTILDRHELPRLSGIRYLAFVDPSGGSADSMTLAIAHRDKDGRAILDVVRERRPPFSPEAVTQEFAELLKDYGVSRVVGDAYSGEWVREPFRTCGIAYEVSDKRKSDIYRDALPLLNSGKVELLDHPRLVTQLCGLERRTARGGKDSIDHAPGGHDDVANAVAGALVLAAGKRPMHIPDSALQIAMEQRDDYHLPRRIPAFF